MRDSCDAGRARQATFASQAALSCASRTISARSAASELNFLHDGGLKIWVHASLPGRAVLCVGRTIPACSAISKLNFSRGGV